MFGHTAILYGRNRIYTWVFCFILESTEILSSQIGGVWGKKDEGK